uniref:Ig-like domain-containing protein n=1 Tax=Gopherus evgoodei TaxID=1825980 RepID=A0A8C4W0A9_9SAUR
GPAPDPSLPRPSISLSPTGVTVPGADITIRCQGQRRDVRFFLHKAGDLNPQRHMDPAGAGAEFRIPTVGRRHGGKPFVSSQPSDTVQLVVMFYPKPSISVSPSGVIPVGGNVTIRCRHQHQNMRFQLYKAGDGNYLSYTDPAGSEAEFPITSARREHGGSYTCRYIYRSGGTVYSEPSDPVQIIVAGEGPSISLSPTGVVASGADVTIRCQGQRRDVRFFLHKAGDLNPQQHMDRTGAGAEFRIPTVGRQHGGNYSCSYRPRSEPFVSSQPSDTVQLVVAGEGYPKPNISLRPSGQVTPGGAVTIRCECRCRGVRVLLSKAGDPDARHSMDPAGDVAEFPIRSVSQRDAGSYRCRYSTNDPVELVVAGEGPSLASCSQPHTQLDTQRGSALMGRSEPGSALSPGLSRGGAELGSGDGATRGFPSQGGAEAAGNSEQRKGGIPAPGGASEQGVFPRGCPASISPSAEFTPHQPRPNHRVTVSAPSRSRPGCSVPSLPHPSQCSF